MKNLLIAFATITLAFTGLNATAAEGEEKTLEGTMSCEKCELGTADKCADALKVAGAEGEEATLYHLEDKEGKRKTEWHQCKGEAMAKVTGVVEDRDGEMFIVVSDLEKSPKKDKEG
jgi:hypothetical protein